MFFLTWKIYLFGGNTQGKLLFAITRGLLESRHEVEFEEAQTTSLQRIALARRPKYTTWKACLYFILNPTGYIKTPGYKFYIFNEIHFLIKSLRA